MKLNVKVILFIFILFSSFSICLAEDFWMKLNWDYETHDIFYSSQDEIYISTRFESTYYRYRSKDEGQNWENYPEILGYPTYIRSLKHISDDGEYLHMYANDSLFVVQKDSSNLKKILDLNFYEMYKINDNYYYLSYGNLIYKSNLDFGDVELALETELGNNFNALALDSAGTLWAGSTDYFEGGGLYKSIDNGVTWIGPESDLYGEFISDISVDSEGRIFVGTRGGSQGTGIIYRSEDNGETWEKVVYHYIHTNKIVINSEDEIFAGLENGRMIHSNDHGDCWEYIDEGLVSPGMINDMVISPSGYVYIATNDGVYRSINSTTGILDSENLISGVELYQNYPNPFNNETNISFSISENAEVDLSVFNTKGEKVKNICNERLDKGFHNYSFKADDVKSGVYFYKLMINGKLSETRKMIYLR